MTMFLHGAIIAEVEPVPGKKNWFQLTGRGIQRESMPCDDMLIDLEHALVKGARLKGVHDFDKELQHEDPRFEGKEPTGFGIIQHENGDYQMFLACNRAEYAVMRFLVPNYSGMKNDLESDSEDNIKHFRKEA
jgi:hypothetical protein